MNFSEKFVGRSADEIYQKTPTNFKIVQTFVIILYLSCTFMHFLSLEVILTELNNIISLSQD